MIPPIFRTDSDLNVMVLWGKYTETQLFYFLILLSLMIHLLFYAFGEFAFSKFHAPFFEEWTMDAELINIIDIDMSDKSAIPDAKKAEELKVDERMLPQLPKKFSIDQPEEKKDEMISPEKEAAEDKITNTDTAQSIDEVKEKDNLLQKNEALKRLALEQLRQEAKTAKESGSPDKDALAKLKSELTSLDTAGLGTKEKTYSLLLQKAMHSNFALPDAYNLKNADLKVVIAIILDEKGNLTHADIEKSSGDALFDEFSLKTVKNSSPLPEPPKELIGEYIYIQFTPKSF